MADRVDPGVESVQPGSPRSVRNRVMPEPQFEQLRSRHHPMLPPRELSQPLLSLMSLQFGAKVAAECRLAGHGRSVAAPDARVVRSG